MIRKTNNYSMFKFREDNRHHIDQGHVKRLAKSIQQKNLLEMRPILVNSDMEVIDGQNRLLAAQQLGIEIYYEIKEELTAADIINLNVSKSWSTLDFMNFYCKNGYIEYQKLDKFIHQHAIPLTVALILFEGRGYDSLAEFKDGHFKYDDSINDDVIELCWETVGKIRLHNTRCPWTDSKKFWKALIRLFLHPDFKIESWRHNRDLKIEHISQRASFSDYLKMVENVYNYKLRDKITLTTTLKEIEEVE